MPCWRCTPACALAPPFSRLFPRGDFHASMSPGLSNSLMRASHIHLLIIATHDGWRAEPAGVQGWLGLGLRSRVFISLGQLIAAFSHSRHVPARSAKGAGASAFPRERCPAGSCRRACLPVRSRCCHFHSGTAASALQALGSSLIRAGKGAKVTRTHACTQVRAVSAALP